MYQGRALTIFGKLDGNWGYGGGVTSGCDDEVQEIDVGTEKWTCEADGEHGCRPTTTDTVMKFKKLT